MSYEHPSEIIENNDSSIFAFEPSEYSYIFGNNPYSDETMRLKPDIDYDVGGGIKVYLFTKDDHPYKTITIDGYRDLVGFSYTCNIPLFGGDWCYYKEFGDDYVYLKLNQDQIVENVEIAGGVLR